MSFKYTIYGLDENMNRVAEVVELDHELSAETLNSFSLVGFPEAQQQRAGDVCEVNPNCSLFKKGSRCDICYSHESRT